MTVVPITLREAHAFVARVHRHHRPARGGLFALAAAELGEVGAPDHAVVAVAVVGRPVARALDDGWTAEVTRLAAIPAARNACSMLYGAAWRAARALGWRRLVTYTLASESGASLRGAGWRELGRAGGGSWSRRQRPRVDLHPTQEKIRWERTP